jgi:hypothetical protein
MQQWGATLRDFWEKNHIGSRFTAPSRRLFLRRAGKKHFRRGRNHIPVLRNPGETLLC